MRNRLFSLFLAAALALPLFAQEPFAKALAAARADENFSPYCGEEKNPRSVVCRAIENDAKPNAALVRIARELAVTPATAQVIGVASLALLRGEKDADAARPLLAALPSEPNRTPLIATLAQVAWASADSKAGYAALLPLIGDDTRMAMAAAEAAVDDDATAIFLGAPLAREPDNAELIDDIGSLTRDTRIRAVFGPLRITSAGAVLRPGAKSLAESGERQLSALAQLGLPHLVVAAFEAFPPAARKEMTATRLDVAAAALLIGREELARTLLPRKGDDSAHKLVAASLPGARADAFEVITAAVSSAFQSPTSGVRGQLFAQFAEQQGYAAIAKELRTDMQRWQSMEKDVPEPFRDAVAAVEQPVPEAPEKPRTTVPSSLDAPRIVPFTEHRLEEATAAGGKVVIIDCSDAERVAATTNLPPFVSPIRMERRGEDVVAIAISSALDPVGEIGMGGYWVLRSRDGGNSWTSFYTGLRENMPYVIPPASHLALLDGDRLRIEVEVRELDLESITFPPVGMRLKRSEKGLYLDLPWAELGRDSDGDGLTDLLEERLTTDPHEIDTDGDGIADGEDQLPRVARSTGHSVESEILAAVLGNFNLGGGRIVVGIGGDLADAEAAQNSCEVLSSQVGDPVIFLVGDPSQFATLTMSRRTIILTEDELMTYSGKFGPTFAAEIRHFAIDPDGTRAVLELNQSWAGATFVVTKTKDGWVAKQTSNWIT